MNERTFKQNSFNFPQRKKWIFLAVCALLLLSCREFTDEELWIKVESAKANKNWDSTQLVCRKILTQYPSGKYASWARFGLAESYRYKNQPREALDNYKIFYSEHHTMQPSALSLFLIGYIYNNNLQMRDSAKYYFEIFLQTFPHHDLIPSVKFELESMGKDPDRALMEQQQRLNSTAKK